MDVRKDNPLIVQSDRTVLLEVDGPKYADARDALAVFAELVKSPEHIHTYRITPLSIWNAKAAGHSADEMVEALTSLAKYPVPQNIVRDIRDYAARYGRVRLVREGPRLILESEDAALLQEAWSNKAVRRYLVERLSLQRIEVDPAMRGHVKQAMIRVGYPVEDLAGFVDGGPLAIALDEGRFRVRRYQEAAVDAFWAGGSARGGSGVVVLPCGAGKTIVGMGAMARVGRKTLVLTTNLTAVRQWREELLAKCRIDAGDIGEYTGERKEIRPVTLSTYQILTYRRSKTESFVHFGLLSGNDWGLIVYDEVHLLPAPVFRVTAEIQATRRLGLTATLVREDGKEDEVFTLIGPKRYDVPWKELERQGFIAQASCTEVRVPLADQHQRLRYATADKREKFRIASENPRKMDTLKRLLARHEGELVLVIGQYLRQLKEIARLVQAPLITGRTPNDERSELYGKFRRGEIRVLVVSKVGNFAIDLPDASVLVQVSGTFGSRQEEAQRLGRILRPKSDGGQAHFYSLVTRDTSDQDFAQNRQLFLTEQGYSYRIVDDRELEAAGGPGA
ncbi:MAG TPA: DNA repair helicase XPB [Planctomycetota bacterium]|nr:DNA repair helicase XPB [Planctomycetota bacterium]